MTRGVLIRHEKDDLNVWLVDLEKFGRTIRVRLGLGLGLAI